MENAYKVIMRIHDAVGATITSDESTGAQAKVTISIGVSQLDKYESIEDTINKADVALYKAKKERNKVVCAQPKEMD
jgi:diguanylate cyclase (GGDEF)-like protein